MRAEDVQQHLLNEPFIPVRVHISDGSSYEIPSPDFAFVWARQVIIGLDPTANGIPRRGVYIDLRHVTHIEPLIGTNGEGNGQSGRQ